MRVAVTAATIAVWAGGTFAALVLFGTGAMLGWMFMAGLADLAVLGYLDGRVFKKSGP